MGAGASSNTTARQEGKEDEYRDAPAAQVPAQHEYPTKDAVKRGSNSPDGPHSSELITGHSAINKSAKLSSKLNPKYNARVSSVKTGASVKIGVTTDTAVAVDDMKPPNKQPDLRFVNLCDDESEDDDEDQNSTDGGLVYDWTAFNDEDDNKEYFAPDPGKVPKMQPLTSSVESLPSRQPGDVSPTTEHVDEHGAVIPVRRFPGRGPPPVHKQTNVAIVDRTGDYDEDGCFAANFSNPAIVPIEGQHVHENVPALNISAMLSGVAKPAPPAMKSKPAPPAMSGPPAINGKPAPPQRANPRAVKETSDVKRNKAQMPSNLDHAKPTAGDWLKKRYIVNNYILLDTLGTGSYGEVGCI